ncbi:MAG: hypothetical protein L6R40_000261 [Gallowayella cf. fulva]|nr:MAG: hypothetical protein L6R40_000261 [Xanthomendoza cf. fulva]
MLAKSILFRALFASLIYSDRTSLVTASSSCYRAYNDTIEEWSGLPCGSGASAKRPYLNCCWAETGSELESRLHRTQRDHNFITYDYRQQVWRCCGNTKDGVSDCEHPTAETFSAPAPVNLSRIYTLSAAEEKLESSSILSNASSISSSILALTQHSSEASTPAPTSNSIKPILSTFTASPTSQPQPAEANGSTIASNTRAELGNGNNIALIVGIPGTLATIVGAYYTYATFMNKKKKEKSKTIIRRIGRTYTGQAQ